jgi:hypothetical protein
VLIVLGFDSLDCRRIDDLETPTVDELAEFGYLEPFEGLLSSELMTTVLWSSMFAGCHPKQLYPEYYDADTPFNVWIEGTWEPPWLRSIPIKSLERFAVRRLSSLLARRRQERLRDRIRSRIGKRSYIQAGLDGTDSVLSVAENPRLISFPGINFDHTNKELKSMVDNSVSGNFAVTDTAERFERRALSADADRLVRTLYAIESRRHDFVATHFFSLDLIQHVWAPNDAKMQRWYAFYDDLLKSVLRAARPTDTVVVVSDHGMKTNGIHSHNAFYGATEELWTGPYRMIDLADVLKTELRRDRHRAGESDQSTEMEIEEETANHLRDLGYI